MLGGLPADQKVIKRLVHRLVNIDTVQADPMSLKKSFEFLLMDGK
jgi:hypothetical protein